MAADTEAHHVRADNETLFLLGNGPSLRDIDLRSLEPHATLGMNAAYRYWRAINWRPTYYACLDTVVGISHKDEISALIREAGPNAIEKFLLRRNLIEALGASADTDKVENFDALRPQSELLAVDPITTGSHAALWAISEGYSQVVLLGVDGRYREIVDGAQRKEGIELEIVEAGENPNYFFDGYQQPGDRYNIPNPRPDLHLSAWRQSALRIENLNARILNANKASAIQFFDFVDLNAFLSTGCKPLHATEAIKIDDDSVSAKKKRKSEFPPNGRLMARLLLVTLIIFLIAIVSISASLIHAGIILAGLSGLMMFGLFSRRQINHSITRRVAQNALSDEIEFELRRQLAIAKKQKALKA